MERYQALVAAAAKQQGDIFLLFDKLAVDDQINAGEHIIRHVRVYASALGQVGIIGVARVAPDIFVRKGRTHALQETRQHLLVLRLKRLAAQQRQPLNIVRLQGFQNGVLRFSGERLPIAEIPGHLVKTAPAVMTAAGYEKADADARSVGNIKIFYLSVIHHPAPFSWRQKPLHFYRCRTRSLISCVRPWFQNCVPI